jgi:hypothetical protein
MDYSFKIPRTCGLILRNGGKRLGPNFGSLEEIPLKLNGPKEKTFFKVCGFLRI